MDAMDASNYESYARAAAFIGAAIAMGIGSIGPAIGQGLVGQKACEGVSKFPDSYKKVRMTMIISMCLIETAAIYAFIVALLITFKI